MTPILLLILTIISADESVIIETEQIQFRTIESCESEAIRLERELSEYNTRAICVNREQ